jgi:hypothetical protein
VRRRYLTALSTLAVVLCAAAAGAQETAARPQSDPIPVTSRFTYRFGVDYMLQVSGRRDYPFHDDTFQDDETFAWWRLRPRFAARSRHLDVVLEGQDTHSAGGSFGTRKAWLDLLNAYVDIKEMKGWAVKVGRQQGDLEVIPRMVRTPDFAAVVRSFDVAEVSWQNTATDVRVFAFKPVDNLPTRFNRQKRGELLWTTYARRILSRRSAIQSYVIARHNREAVSQAGVPGSSAVYAWDFQVTGPTPLPQVGWTVETVLERGHYSVDDIRAWGMFLRTDIDLPGAHTLDARYTVTSGDGDKEDGVRSNYDTFYAASSNFGSLGQVRGVNVRALTVGGSIALASPLTLNWRYFNTHLHDRRDVWYGAVVPNLLNPAATSSFLGQETNLTLTYRLSPQLQVRAAYHRFFPGGYEGARAAGDPHEFRLQLIGSR